MKCLLLQEICDSLHVVYCMLYGFEKWRNLHGDYGTSGEANLKGFWTIVS